MNCNRLCREEVTVVRRASPVRPRPADSPPHCLIWLVFALMARFLGSLLWFLIGRRDTQRGPGIA